MKSAKALMLESGTPSASMLAEKHSNKEYDQVHFARSDVLSIPTTELPSTTEASFQTAPDDTLLYADSNRVRPPRLSYENGRTRASRPGWQAPRSAVRFSNTRNVNAIVGLICHLCYTRGHTSPQCVLTMREWAPVVANYESLSPDMKASVPMASYIRVKMDIPRTIAAPIAQNMVTSHPRTPLEGNSTATADASAAGVQASMVQNTEHTPQAKSAKKN